MGRIREPKSRLVSPRLEIEAAELLRVHVGGGTAGEPFALAGTGNEMVRLEIRLTRDEDPGMFMEVPLRRLAFDEERTYTGAVGEEVTCLIRRVCAFCGKRIDKVLTSRMSATITEPVGGEKAGRARERGNTLPPLASCPLPAYTRRG